MKLKLVKESLNENIKFDNHEYEKFHVKEGEIFASKEGILGDKKLFVSWDMIKQLMKKFNIV